MECSDHTTSIMRKRPSSGESNGNKKVKRKDRMGFWAFAKSSTTDEDFDARDIDTEGEKQRIRDDSNKSDAEEEDTPNSDADDDENSVSQEQLSERENDYVPEYIPFDVNDSPWAERMYGDKDKSYNDQSDDQEKQSPSLSNEEDGNKFYKVNSKPNKHKSKIIMLRQIIIDKGSGKVPGNETGSANVFDNMQASDVFKLLGNALSSKYEEFKSRSLEGNNCHGFFYSRSEEPISPTSGKKTSLFQSTLLLSTSRDFSTPFGDANATDLSSVKSLELNDLDEPQTFVNSQNEDTQSCYFPDTSSHQIDPQGDELSSKANLIPSLRTTNPESANKYAVTSSGNMELDAEEDSQSINYRSTVIDTELANFIDLDTMHFQEDLCLPHINVMLKRSITRVHSAQNETTLRKVFDLMRHCFNIEDKSGNSMQFSPFKYNRPPGFICQEIPFLADKKTETNKKQIYKVPDRLPLAEESIRFSRFSEPISSINKKLNWMNIVD